MAPLSLWAAWCRPDEGDAPMGDMTAKAAEPSTPGGKTGK
jgi:hypothetical protein